MKRSSLFITVVKRLRAVLAAVLVCGCGSPSDEDHGDIVLDVTFGIDGITWEQERLEQIVTGGDGPTRIRFRRADDGVILADVRAESFDAAVALMGQRLADRDELISYEDFDSMSELQKARVIEGALARADDAISRIDDFLTAREGN